MTATLTATLTAPTSPAAATHRIADTPDPVPSTVADPRDPDRIVVVGAGLAGLAAACTLASRGHRVTIVDKNPWLGGKAAVLHAQADPARMAGGGDNGGARFRFDMGPTILTYPKVLERIFAESGRKLSDYLDNHRLDPQWRCFFGEGEGRSLLDLRDNVEAMQRSMRDFGCTGEAIDGYARLIDYARDLHRISDRFFFWKPIGGIGDMFELKSAVNIDMLRDVLKMRMGRSVATTMRGFVPDDRVAQMLDHYCQYVGSSPYNAPAILTAIAAMQADDGVWYPMGGTRAVPEALMKLAAELGVEMVAGQLVREIKRDAAGPVSGVVLQPIAGHGGTGAQADVTVEVAAKAVVSNMDSVRTYRELCGMADFNADDRFEPACSGVVLYLGLDKQYEHLAHHDFVFSRDPEEEFDHIYRRGEPAPDPTAYLANPVVTERAVAPDGGSAMYVLVHTPYLRHHHDWDRHGGLFRSYRDTILDKLERTAGLEGIREHIVYEEALTPRDIHERYRVLNGAIYGLASHGKFFGAFKPNNRSPKVPGLYLAGGAAHPGPGMPMVMMSGWIAGDTADTDLKAAAPA